MAKLNKSEIFNKLPDHFWSAFAGELVAIFGINIFEKDESGLQQLDYMSGTSGWNAALRSVCHRLDISWFYDWYDALDWADSDDFDGDLLYMLNTRIGINLAYYRWLVGKMREDNKVEAAAET